MSEKPEDQVRIPTWQEQGCFPARYFVALMTFIGMIFNYMLRVNMNFAIVAMVKGSSNNESDYGTECNFDDEDDHGEDYEGEFEWDEMTQSYITAAFFWGYIVTQVPGGRLAEIIGAKRVFGGAVTTAAVITCFIPLAARWHYGALIALRVLLGISEGASFPSTHALLSCWAPPFERSKMSTIIYAGSQAGTIIGFPLSAAIIDSLGWEAVFYIQAAMTLCWSLLWFLLITDKPEQMRWISAAEKNYIKESIGSSKQKKAPPVPWKHVATSLPLWAILLCGIGNNWGFYTLLTDLPLYMKTMMRKDIKSNALLSGMPYLGMMIFSFISSAVVDYIIKNKYLRVVTARKLITTISHVGPGICLACLTFVECNRDGTTALLFVAVALQGGIYSGFLVNHIDIAPNYAGTLFGITNGAATIPSWIAPLTVGALTNGQQTLAQWRKVFYISAVLYIADAIIYLIFGSGTEQSWNKMYVTDSEQGVLTNEKVKGNRSLELIQNTSAVLATAPSTSDDNYNVYVRSSNIKSNYDNPSFVNDR